MGSKILKKWNVKKVRTRHLFINTEFRKSRIDWNKIKWLRDRDKGVFFCVVYIKGVLGK